MARGPNVAGLIEDDAVSVITEFHQQGQKEDGAMSRKMEITASRSPRQTACSEDVCLACSLERPVCCNSRSGLVGLVVCEICGSGSAPHLIANCARCSAREHWYSFSSLLAPCSSHTKL
ncbi:uncharacterized protein LOC110431690 isoform X2 [Sorghum bicolor]|uniref:uncharacterized protein LOC110431690 isoform X2 n=1 Tax=Sorghum bicolor TaxID=4558 RepID=UPI000B42674E|nr:uncharacterized protein LOC110431690 isoform X2 [Sorghum bicolor]|eukprot:XP_021306723.1 uncharacterized protein LOC110431690 isoform X2 [Sorghum bicolor]